ncbi:hypothetical protein AMECASPLE_019618 [Ameca splendens]|uniref:Uncharacterized protein n=1 Tax=Ameca splendens TaxID=208324 RepID=A0ABV1A1R4_9TELE
MTSPADDVTKLDLREEKKDEGNADRKCTTGALGRKVRRKGDERERGEQCSAPPEEGDGNNVITITGNLPMPRDILKESLIRPPTHPHSLSMRIHVHCTVTFPHLFPS